MTIDSSINNNFYNYSSNGLTQSKVQEETPVAVQPVEDTKPQEDTKPDDKDLSKQDAVALYYNYQANQLTKDILNIYAEGSTQEDESTTVDFQDIHSLQQQVNRGNALEEIASKPVDEREDIDYKEIVKPGNGLPEDVSQEEAVALYYNYQANQLTKDVINIYAQGSSQDSESTTVDFSDISELQKQINRGTILDEAGTKPKEERPDGGFDKEYLES